MRFFSLRILIALLIAGPALADSTTRPASRPATKPVKPPVPLPTTVGDHKLKFQFTFEGQPVKMAYLLYLPTNYTTTKEPCPVLVFLHGGGEAGEDLAGVFVHGPNMNLHRDDYAHFRETFPFIVISPQCPPRGERWDQPKMIKAVVALIQDIETRLPKVDKDRVYLTGLSMGGKGTWLVSEEGPQLFAAIAPMDADTLKPEIAPKLKYTPVWMGVGQDDGSVVDATQKMEQALRKVSHAEIERTVLPHVGHGAWVTFYENPQFYEWFLEHRRPTDAEKKLIDTQPIPTTHPAALPPETAFGHHIEIFTTKLGDHDEAIPYTIFLPKTYSPTGMHQPLILFLHEQIAIGTPINGFCLHGPDAELERNASFKNTFDAVVVSPSRLPQFPKWDDPAMSRALLALVDDVCARYRIDTKRIYLAGLNEGAVGAWMLALQAPDRFAALVPVIAEGNVSLPGTVPEPMKDMSVWSFIPSSDGNGRQEAQTLFKGFRADCILTPVLPNTVGEATQAFREMRIYEWMLRHRRK